MQFFELFGIFGIFGVVDILIILGVVASMYIGIILDSREVPQVKWVFILIAISFCIWHYSLVGKFTNWDVAKNSLIYLGIGFVYSLLEFFIAVRKSKEYYKLRWEEYPKDGTNTKWDYEDVAADDAVNNSTFPQSRQKVAIDVPKTPDQIKHDFIVRQQAHSKIVMVRINEETKEIEPYIQPGELSASLSAWTLLWPFYGLYLVLNDMLLKLFDHIAKFFAALFSEQLKRFFRNTFTFKV